MTLHREFSPDGVVHTTSRVLMTKATCLILLISVLTCMAWSFAAPFKVVTVDPHSLLLAQTQDDEKGILDPFVEFDGSEGETVRPHPQEPIRSPWRRKRLPRREEFPIWKVDRAFDKDVFTFVRVQYDAAGPFGWWDRWDNDYPDGDWNFSFRLQQLTSLEVDPYGRVLRLTDPEIFNYPFLYMAGVQSIMFSQEERKCLRRYLLNGGFVMMDDFWGDRGWNNVRTEMNRVLPRQRPKELQIDHPIFHCVYKLKELPQVCDLKTWSEGYRFEFWHEGFSVDQKPHFWGYHDPNGRLVALCCHNNDLGDGWEREGENKAYFKEFSEKKSYPMGINIITYAMTH